MAGEWILGYELTRRYAQICCYNPKTKEPESADPSMGLSKFQIPAALLKLPGSEDYLYGHEAVRAAADGRGILTDNLLYRASQEDARAVEELAVFIRKSLRTVNTGFRPEDVRRITFTLPQITGKLLEGLYRAVDLLKIPRERVGVQDYRESFYTYVMHQKQELRSYAVALFLYEKNLMSCYELSIHRKSFPKVVTVSKTGEMAFLPEDKTYLGYAGGSYAREKDQKFSQFAQEMLRTKLYSSIYLTGDGFEEPWFPETLKLLCRGRRVFSGRNLFVKGACYRSMEELESGQGTEFLYMGQHKITYNIGMEVLRNGRKEYFGIISAGVNWYEASGSCEFLLDGTNGIELLIQSIDRSDARKILIPLDGLPERPNRTTRLRLSIEFGAVRECQRTVEDVGFGEWYPSSGKTWTEKLKL